MASSLIAAFLVWILGGFVLMTTGMGGPLLCLPLMLLFVDLPVVVVMSNVLGTLSCVALVLRYGRYVDKRLVWPLVLGSVPGVLLGVLSLRFLPLFWLELGVGLLLLAFVCWQFGVSGTRVGKTRDGTALLLAGGAGAAFCGGSVGVAAPPMALMAYLGGWEKNMARGVFGVYFVASGIFVCLCLWWQGLMTPTALEHTLAALPGMLLGTALGVPAASRLPQELFRKCMLAVVLVGGLSLLYKAFFR